MDGIRRRRGAKEWGESRIHVRVVSSAEIRTCPNTHLTGQDRTSVVQLRASELGHNSGACSPSRMTLPNRPLFWIASLIRKKASTRPPSHWMPTLWLVALQRRPLALYLRASMELKRHKAGLRGSLAMLV